MSRQVKHDGRGAFEIRFPFDRRLVDLVKTLPNRRWKAEDRFWWAPEDDVLEVVELLHPEGFRFDDATRYAAGQAGIKDLIEKPFTDQDLLAALAPASKVT